LFQNYHILEHSLAATECTILLKRKVPTFWAYSVYFHFPFDSQIDTTVSTHSTKRLVPTTKSQLSHVLLYIISSESVYQEAERETDAFPHSNFKPSELFHVTLREIYANGRKNEVHCFQHPVINDTNNVDARTYESG